MFLSAPLWGIIADRWGRKLMVLRAMFGAAVVLALTGLAPNIYYVIALRFAQGLFSGTVAAASALVAASIPNNKMPFAMGLLMVAVFSIWIFTFASQREGLRRCLSVARWSLQAQKSNLLCLVLSRLGEEIYYLCKCCLTAE